MKHVVMGTSGHVDHGKTSLIHRLTGIDTDRLKEEKKRGMTIELGFAPLKMPDGKVVSVIDVPGHESLIKTMVAGASTIDFVLMVIAADEGIMPQTREHLQILSLLGVKKGIIAISKADLVDDEWLELVTAEIAESVSDTFLADAPVIPVSVRTGIGINDLRSAINVLANQVETVIPSLFFRLPIDRVFTIAGYGTVITGTLMGGKINKGDAVQVLPSMKVARVRGIQVHGEQVESAAAGDRCALNLAGIEKEEISRGDYIVFPETLKPTRLLDASLTVVDELDTLKHGQRVRIHLGTAEVMGKIRLIGKEEMLEGEQGYVQLRTEKPVVAVREDRFILRFYSPVRVIAGGRVLNHRVPNRPRFAERTMQVLTMEDQGQPEDLISISLGKYPLSSNEIALATFLPEITITETLEKLIKDKQLVSLPLVRKWLAADQYDKLATELSGMLAKYLRQYSFREGMDREEIRSRLFAAWEAKDFNAFVDVLCMQEVIVQKNNLILDPHNNQKETLLGERITQEIQRIYHISETVPPSVKKLAGELSCDENQIIERLNFLLREGILVGNNIDMLFLNGTIERIKQIIREMLDETGEITVADFRDRINGNRQSAIALLEYFDANGFTSRKENVRIKGPRYNLEK